MLYCSMRSYKLLKQLDTWRLTFPLFRDEAPSRRAKSWTYSQNLGTSCKRETNTPQEAFTCAATLLCIASFE